MDVPIYPGDAATLEELIAYYFRLNYKIDDIRGFLYFVHGIIISHSKAKRTLRRLNLKRNKCEVDFETIVTTILHLHENGYRNCGYKMLWVIMNVNLGIRVTQNTLRLALNVIDPEGINLRLHRRLHRRIYYNKGPNYLIHIDGNDKLKPYGICIHGAIDGFSRRILWLKAGYSNNNPKLTGRLYIEYIREIEGFPRCIRADAGTENTIIRDIQRALYTCSNLNRRYPSYIRGKSSANQRIERFWGILRTSFINEWKNFFKDLCDTGCLDTSNNIHLECVRFVFLPMIQIQLDTCKDAWNLHRVRRQNHVTTPTGIPNVLFYQPWLYDALDYSIPLPFDLDTLDEFKNEFTIGYPPLGCSDDFIQLVEALTNKSRDDFAMPTTMHEGLELYSCLIELVNVIENAQ